MTPEDLGITQHQRNNLEKLAVLLEAVEESGFDMGSYVVAADDEFHTFSPRQACNTECGTVACAAGHLVGIVKPLKGEGWDAFIDRATGVGNRSIIWCWLFHGAWASVDNTARGASRRIKYFLERDVPDDWEEQLNGWVELRY